MDSRQTSRPVARAKKAYGTLPPRQLNQAAPGRAPQVLPVQSLCRSALRQGRFFEELSQPTSVVSQQVRAFGQALLGGPVKSRRVAMVGCSEAAAGLSVLLARHGRKVCLLDLNAPGHELAWMLGLNAWEPGVSELLSGQTGLEYLMVRAKTLAPAHNCYILPRGGETLDFSRLSERLQTLVAALESKFHHIIVCLPDPASNPATVRLLHELAIPRAGLLSQMTAEQAQRLRRALPACRILPLR